MAIIPLLPYTTRASGHFRGVNLLHRITPRRPWLVAIAFFLLISQIDLAFALTSPPNVLVINTDDEY
jgi:hypothetical protein